MLETRLPWSGGGACRRPRWVEETRYEACNAARMECLLPQRMLIVLGASRPNAAAPVSSFGNLMTCHIRHSVASIVVVARQGEVVLANLNRVSPPSLIPPGQAMVLSTDQRETRTMSDRG
jgi:hypothetical protein